MIYAHSFGSCTELCQFEEWAWGMPLHQLLLLLLQSCLTLCDPTDRSPPGSSIPGSLQARILEWVAISFSNACMHAKSLQSCPTLCDPMDSSPPGSSVHEILQARILEWVAISFSKRELLIARACSLAEFNRKIEEGQDQESDRQGVKSSESLCTYKTYPGISSV